MSAPEVERLRQDLLARQVPSVRVTLAESETRTPHRRRRAEAKRSPALPGLTLRALRGRDSLAGIAEHLAIEIEGHSANLVGVPRHQARELLLDAGVRSMPDPVRGCQVFRAADVNEVFHFLRARGHTVVIRPEVAA